MAAFVISIDKNISKSGNLSLIKWRNPEINESSSLKRVFSMKEERLWRLAEVGATETWRIRPDVSNFCSTVWPDEEMLVADLEFFDTTEVIALRVSRKSQVFALTSLTLGSKPWTSPDLLSTTCKATSTTELQLAVFCATSNVEQGAFCSLQFVFCS